MSMEFQSAEAPPVDAPIDAPAQSEPVSQPDASSFDKSFEQVHDRVDPPRESNGQYRRPPEYRPEAPPSEAPELEAQEPKQTPNKPVSWSPKIAEKWGSLDPEIQQEILRREQDVQRYATKTGEAVKSAQAINAVIEDYAARLPEQERAIPRQEHVKLLYAANEALRTDPVRAIQYLAQAHGVDLAQLAGGQTQQAEPSAEDLIRQAQEHAYAQARQQYEMQEQQRWQAQATQLAEHVNKFASDKPHWAELEPEILHHVYAARSANPEMDPRQILQTAYDKALAANPQYDVAKKSEIKRRADEARRIASMNVKSIGGVIARSGGKWQDDLGRIYDFYSITGTINER